MMLTISLRHRLEDKCITVMVDSDQKIGGTLEVLTQAGILDGKGCRMVRSARTKERIHTEKTYKEGHIYNGDILTFE
ncbi:MAG: hypothetical protein HDR71_07370 [Lachnospiraceae bacterium]|nr:hypothetical protein [Lachnospiraceae bacterium]